VYGKSTRRSADKPTEDPSLHNRRLQNSGGILRHKARLHLACSEGYPVARRWLGVANLGVANLDLGVANLVLISHSRGVGNLPAGMFSDKAPSKQEPSPEEVPAALSKGTPSLLGPRDDGRAEPVL